MGGQHPDAYPWVARCCLHTHTRCRTRRRVGAATTSTSVVVPALLCHVDRRTMKEVARYGLDILRNEEDAEVCFGVNLVDKLAGDEVPVGVVVRHLEAEDVVDYLLPLKKMRFLGTEVLVPNNPIAFLEKMYEDKFDVLKETDLFKETGSKMEQWKKVGGALFLCPSASRRWIRTMRRCVSTRRSSTRTTSARSSRTPRFTSSRVCYKQGTFRQHGLGG